MAYRVPPSRDPHLTLQPHPWGDGAAPPLAPPPPIIAYLSATWKQRTVQRPQPSELLPLTLIPSRSAPLNEEAVGASLLLPAHAHGRAVGAAAWPQVHPEVVRGA